jgi:hypothetical protein
VAAIPANAVTSVDEHFHVARRKLAFEVVGEESLCRFVGA